MIGYTTVGTNDLDKAAAFYDALFAEIGAKRTMQEGSFIAWGISENDPMFCAIQPNDGNPATVGNGVMIALMGKSQEEVDRVYAKAMALGACDEGKPGDRGNNFYAAYFRDLDGNKLNIFYYPGA